MAERAASVAPWIRTGFVWAMAASRIGGAVSGVATALVAYDRSRSVLVTAVVTVASGLPVVVLAAPASALVQRVGAPRLFVVASAVLGLITLVPAALAAGGHLDTLSLFVFQLVCGVIAGLASPAYPLLVQRLARPGMVPEFNARLGRSAAASAIAGLLLGGAIVGAFGASWAFLLDALSYVPAVIVIGSVLGRLPKPVHEHQRLRDGLRSVRVSAGLRSAFLATAVLNLLATPVISTFPALASTVSDSAGTLAVLMAAYAAGGVFVATAVRWLHGRRTWAFVGRWALAASGAGLVGLGLAVRLDWSTGLILAISVVALIPTGLAVAVDSAVLNALVQLGAPEDERGPVLTAYATIAAFVAPIGGLAIGVLADSVSVSFAVIASGALLLAAAGGARAIRLFRAFDDLEHQEVPRIAAGADRAPVHGHPSREVHAAPAA